MVSTHNTYTEIKSSPTVWEQTLTNFLQKKSELESFLRQDSFDQVLFTGCGSTHYLSQTAAALFQNTTRVPSSAHPSSEIWIYPDQILNPGGKKLLVAISRSAETSETIEAVHTFRKYNQGKVLVITNYPGRALAQLADFLLAAPAGQEQSVAQTRSFSSMLLLAQLLAGTAAGLAIPDTVLQLPQLCQNLFDEQETKVLSLAEDSSLENFFFLGGGPLYGIASEAMLKMKEMSLSHSEAFHPLEFRHGPMSMVDPRALVIGLLSQPGFILEQAVLRDMAALKGKLLAIGTAALPSDHPAVENQIILPPDLPDWMKPVLYLPMLQLLAYHRAVYRGQNPDQPVNLEAVVRLE
ncbi:MAG: SIS domain-containing protein [Anaerolineales bacterium]|nr:SIS domain-containing protein [Anaerolineales bacterium]